MFALYLPAAKAGFVSDFTGWLDQVQNHSFAQYINRSNFDVVSLYQVTQAVTWGFYQLFGINAWLWHLLFITLHVVNATLLYRLCSGMLLHSGAPRHRHIATTACVLFCITPYLSEVVVWEPSFHYLQGLLILLLIMRAVQQYMLTPAGRHIWLALVLYALSTHTLEVFYITPWLALSLAFFYRPLVPSGPATFRRAARYFFLPLLALFALRILEFRILHGDWTSRVGSSTIMDISESGLGKPAKYLFNLLLLGRYLPSEWHLSTLKMSTLRDQVYTFFDSAPGLIIFYSLSILTPLRALARRARLSAIARASVFFWGWSLAALLLVTPMWFGTVLLIVYDRYTYFAAPFFFTLLATALWSIRGRYLRTSLLTILLLANLRFSVQASRYWGKAQHIIHNLLHNLPASQDKIVILLNLPDSMHGAAMIAASQPSEYRLMRNLLTPQAPYHGKLYDAMSFNMDTPDDGAHVRVINDSTVRVALNQYATWWWYAGFGGHDYENEDYTIRMTGGDFELTMKHPASQYQLFYLAGRQWKQVNMNVSYDQY